MPFSAARVAEHLPTGHHPVGDPTEPLGGPHHPGAPVHSGRPPGLSQAAEVVVALQQVLGDQQEHVPQCTIGSADERPGAIHLSLWYREG